MGQQVTVQKALQYIADNPEEIGEITIDQPTWALVARRLFDISLSADDRVRGSRQRATRAQRLIFDRLTGLRAAGTAPHGGHVDELEFHDLTEGGGQ